MWKEKLKAYCSTLGIESVGIAPIGPYTELEEFLKGKMEKGHYTSFEESDIQKRVDPRYTMENVASIIVCLFPYYVGDHQEANLSKYTFGIDYHILAKAKLNQIGDYLQENIEGFTYQSFVDTGSLPDRYLAHLAGLGFWGINSHIITEKYGSYVFIGYIVNNYPFEADQPQERTCYRCGNCVRACPGQIILGDFSIDPRGCRSFLTQKKGELSREEVNTIKRGKLVFGCDVCQEVCPHNRKAETTNMKEFSENIMYQLDHEEVKSMSNKEFKRKYGNRAFSWRGKGILVRNFEIIKENL